MKPAWVACPDCDEFFCTIHRMHACDCDCPPIEEWAVDPYTTGGQALTTAPAVVSRPARPTRRTRVSRPGGRSAKL